MEQGGGALPTLKNVRKICEEEQGGDALPTLKNVRKIWEVEKPNNARARKVVMPPLKTAGPMVDTASRDLSSLEPYHTYQG